VGILKVHFQIQNQKLNIIIILSDTADILYQYCFYI